MSRPILDGWAEVYSAEVYARTDIGGLYKSTDGGSNWVPLLDWVNWSNWGYSGVLSVGLDPENGNTIHAAVGAHTTICFSGLICNSH